MNTISNTNTNTNTNSTGDRKTTTVDNKSKAVNTNSNSNSNNNTGKRLMDRSFDANASTSKSTTKNRASPGFHLSCVYRDGTRQETHFPSVPICCLGMGIPTEEEEETKTFKTFSRVPDDFRMVEYDDYEDNNHNHSDSADYLVRRLRKEEEAAAARKAGANRAPLASFEFATNNNLANTKGKGNGNGIGADRRKTYEFTDNHYHYHSAINDNDDVSEMTRGSGWASGVSEILDDTDLRHQPRVVLDELGNQY